MWPEVGSLLAHPIHTEIDQERVQGRRFHPFAKRRRMTAICAEALPTCAGELRLSGSAAMFSDDLVGRR